MALLAALLVAYLLTLYRFARIAGSGVFAVIDTVTRDTRVARLVFFRHINECETHENYYEDFVDCTSADALKDVVFQVREVSALVERKYRYYNRAWKNVWYQFVCAVIIVVIGPLLTLFRP